jgi:hypothetical protein
VSKKRHSTCASSDIPAADWAAHTRLGITLRKLADIEQRRRDPSEDASLAIEALAAVVDLIEADEASRECNAAGPLKRLQSALHNLQRGLSPELFAKPSSTGRPIDTTSDTIRGLLAAAADALIKAGVPRNEAGAIVARKVVSKRIPITGLSSGGVKATTVLRWRDEWDVVKSQAFRNAFKEITDYMANLASATGRKPTRQEAMMVLEAAVESAAGG